MPISRITGISYCNKTQSKTWHNNLRYKQALKLSQMFNFSLCQPDTEQNLLHAVDTLQHMYCVLNMSNYQFVQKYNWPNKYFTGFLEALGITRKSKKDSLKNYARICGKEITDEKKIYWQACQFSFSPYSDQRIVDFHLLESFGMYHAKNNPHGMTRDHMYSIYDGWKNNVDPSLISHPANCHIMSHRDNSSKNNGSTITLSELERRISAWSTDQSTNINQVSPTKQRPKMTEATKQKLREANKKENKKYYTDGQSHICVYNDQIVPAGFHPVLKTTRSYRIFHRASQWDNVDWNQVQLDLNNKMPLSTIRETHGITKDALHWAKKGGLIDSWYTIIPYKDRFPWESISKSLQQGLSLKEICHHFNISIHQIQYAKSKNLL